MPEPLPEQLKLHPSIQSPAYSQPSTGIWIESQVGGIAVLRQQPDVLPGESGTPPGGNSPQAGLGRKRGEAKGRDRQSQS